MKQKPLTLQEIGKRISAHLRRFEQDPVINKADPKYRTRPYYHAGAGARGNRVFVTYVSYQGPVSLTKAEALTYLAWLGAGNVGEHYRALEKGAIDHA